MKHLVIVLFSMLLAAPGFAEPVPEPAPAPEPKPAPAPDAAPVADTLPESAFVEFDAIANHYKCYQVTPLFNTLYPGVRLSDQFKQSEAQVIRPRYLCNPVKKNETTIVDETLHYVCFDIVQNFEPALPDVQTSNQFGIQRLRPTQTELLCLPSKKEHI